MITYYNNFDKFKHIIYATLLEIPSNGHTTTVFPQFLEQCQLTLAQNKSILRSSTEFENNLQRVGVANGATN